MPKADTHNTHPTLDALPCVLNQLDDPRVVVERVMPRPRDEHGVDVLERGVRGQVVDDIVARESQERGEWLWRCEGLAGAGQERSEDAAVAAVLCVGVRLWSVGEEDG